MLRPAQMLARSLVWHKLNRTDFDAVDIEERCISILNALIANQDQCWKTNRYESIRRRQSVEGIREAISLHPERKWTLAALAQIANMSPCHLAHVFREDVGASLFQYIL